jgi:hypothetical protein
MILPTWSSAKRQIGRFEFVFEKYGIKIKNKIFEESDQPFYIRNSITFGSVRRAFSYTGAGFIFLVIDKKKGELANPPSGLYGSIPPGGSEPTGAFAFRSKTPEDRKKIIDFLKSVHKENSTIVVISAISNPNEDMATSEWEKDKTILGTDLFNEFEKIGAVKFAQFKKSGTVPYILISTKNSKGISRVLDEKITLSKNDIIESDLAIDAVFKKSGKLLSVLIGPTPKWNELKFNITEKSDSEKSFLNIVGINDQGTESSLKSNLTQNTSLNDISANNHKYLKLLNTNIDSTEVTATQLKHWRISYDALPDAAISFVKTEPNLASNEIKQGEKIKIFYDVTNVNYVGMDSILVKYSYVTGENQ